MQKNTKVFIDHCIANRGYSEKDILVCDFNDVGTKMSMSVKPILIVEKIDWSYDSFGSDVDSLKNTSFPCFVFTDGVRFLHIFVRDEKGNYIEESDVPNLNLSESVIEDNSFREQLSAALWQFINSCRGFFDREQVSDLFLIAVKISRDKEWGLFRDAIDDPNKLSNFILSKQDNVALSFPYIFNTTGVVAPIEVLKSMVIFENFDFDGHPCAVAELFLKIFMNRYDASINPELAALLCSFIRGKTAIMSADLSRFVINTANDCSADCELYTQSVFVQKICFLCGYNKEIKYQWEIRGMYDTIIVAPPFGVMDRSHPHYDSVYGDKPRDLVARIIEESMYHLNEGGRLVALVPMGFLFKPSEAKLRSKLTRDYHVSFIQVLKKALEPISGIDTAIMVIENTESKGCMTSINTVDVGQYDVLSTTVHDYLSTRAVIEGYFMVDNQIMDESWVPSRMFVDSENNDRDPSDDVLLSEIAEIISGVQISSSEYIKPDSFGGIPYVRVSDYNSDGINLAKAIRVPGKYAKNLAAKGDILFSVTATIGKMTIVGDETFVPGSQSVLIRPNQDIDPHKIIDALSTDDVAIQISGMQTGSTIRHLSRASLAKVRLDRRRLI